MKVYYDGKGTHLDWQYENMTPKMVDWFWSNMEKSFLLWHPSQHEPLEWAKAPKVGEFVGAIHIAPQTWNDGTRQNLYIRFEDLAQVPDWVKDYIVFDHCVVVAGIGLGEEALANPQVMGYRIHQWQKTDYGIEGKSSAIGMLKAEDEEAGKIWAAHCAEEIGNWQHFLPSMYQLFKVVENEKYNPYNDLSLEGSGSTLKYKNQI